MMEKKDESESGLGELLQEYGSLELPVMVQKEIGTDELNVYAVEELQRMPEDQLQALEKRAAWLILTGRSSDACDYYADIVLELTKRNLTGEDDE